MFQVVCSLIMTIYTVTIYEWFYLEKYTNQMPSFFKASLFCFIRGIEILLFVTVLQVRIIPKNPKIEGKIFSELKHRRPKIRARKIGLQANSHFLLITTGFSSILWQILLLCF